MQLRATLTQLDQVLFLMYTRTLAPPAASWTNHYRRADHIDIQTNAVPILSFSRCDSGIEILPLGGQALRIVTCRFLRERIKDRALLLKVRR